EPAQTPVHSEQVQAPGIHKETEVASKPKPGKASMGLPTPADAGVRFHTQPVEVPTQRTCFNRETSGGFAKELIHGMERLVVVHGGERPIPDQAWPDFEVKKPWVKNQNLHTRFAHHCVYRSPQVGGNCQGAACTSTRTVGSYTWNTVAGLLANVCFPQETGSCSGLHPQPGSFSVTVLRKCQTFTLEGDLYVTSDGKGNRYVVHATASETPRLDPELPEGWKIERIPAKEPLQIVPFGEGDDCYHVIAIDNLGQLYTQFAFADEIFPPGAPKDNWERIKGKNIAETLTAQPVDWAGQGRQTWESDGSTRVPYGSGTWKVEGDSYCSQFPGQQERCFSIAQSPDGTRIRVTGNSQISWVGTRVNGPLP
ncbi:MAG: hypothetical protein ACPG4T_06975, partial [Nannocystaceae bacterium]